MNLETKDDALVYNVMVADKNKLISFVTHRFRKSSGQYSRLYLLVKDLKDKERYHIAGTLKASKGYSEISLNPQNLVLNYESWKVASIICCVLGERESMPIICVKQARQ
jgi:hypothetical protein